MSQRLALLLLLVTGCGAPRVDANTHGVSVPEGPCGRGLVVAQSDYQSTNISLIDFDGAVLSSSIANSSTESGGFGVSLSKDVVLPLQPQQGPELVLIDRKSPGVLSFVELASGRARAQLPVGTGFFANPQDYLQLEDGRAYVSRYESNANPGLEAFDAGGDLLIIDPGAPKVLGRVDLALALAGEPERFSPHPAQLLEVEGRVFALLAAYARNYQSSAESRLVELDPANDSILSTLVLDGLHGCLGLAVSPGRGQLAVSCAGNDLGDPPPKLDGSGLALIDIRDGTPRLERTFAASEVAQQVIGFGVDYAAEHSLFFGAFGEFDTNGAFAKDDVLLRLDTESGEVSELRRSRGEPFTLAGARCEVACGVCFATDAARSGGSVLRFPIDEAGALGEPTLTRVGTEIGLPPRYLGAF